MAPIGYGEVFLTKLDVLVAGHSIHYPAGVVVVANSSDATASARWILFAAFIKFQCVRATDSTVKVSLHDGAALRKGACKERRVFQAGRWSYIDELAGLGTIQRESVLSIRVTCH